MSEIDNLTERLAALEAERSEVRMQIAARHGVDPTHDVAPTERPADERQAELSEGIRKETEAASEVVPAGHGSTVDANRGFVPEDEDGTDKTTDKPAAGTTPSTSTPAPAKPRASTGKE